MIVNTSRVKDNVIRVDVNDRLVGFAFRMLRGKWRAFGPNMTTQIGKADFKRAKAAIEAVVDTVQEAGR